MNRISLIEKAVKKVQHKKVLTDKELSSIVNSESVRASVNGSDYRELNFN